MTPEQLKTVATRKHYRLEKKQEVYRLLADSYSGGTDYQTGDHLFKHPKEGNVSYRERIKRAVYFNHVQPLADTLAGFLYRTPPTRKIPTEIAYIETKASKGKDLGSFMQSLAIHSLMYTCGVLVDSPSFDPEDIPTMAARKEAGLNPFFVFYYPWQIKDFYCDDNGVLQWIALDNSYVDKDDPFTKGEKKDVTVLWTTQKQYTIVGIADKKNGEKTYSLESETEHNLGRVPFVFSNFRDQNEDNIQETPFEDIAFLDRTLYNYLSCLDELIYGGTIRMLAYPTENGKDIPEALKIGGISDLQVLPYKGSFSPPGFIGASLDDAEKLKNVFDMIMKEIFQKVGMDKDQEKSYVQSGAAKAYEFERAEAFLRIGAGQMEQVEKSLLEILLLWEQMPTKTEGIEIKYQKSFNEDDITKSLQRLYEVMTLPFKAIQERAVEDIVRKTFSYLDSDDIQKIVEGVKTETQVKEDTKKTTGVESSAIEEEAKARLKGTVGGG